jgi:hypothetical protein
LLFVFLAIFIVRTSVALVDFTRKKAKTDEEVAREPAFAVPMLYR